MAARTTYLIRQFVRADLDSQREHDVRIYYLSDCCMCGPMPDGKPRIASDADIMAIAFRNRDPEHRRGLLCCKRLNLSDRLLGTRKVGDVTRDMNYVLTSQRIGCGDMTLKFNDLHEVDGFAVCRNCNDPEAVTLASDDEQDLDW